MLQNLKDKVTSPEFKQVAKVVVKEVVTAVVVAITIKTISYIAVEGTKALINEIGNKRS